MNRGEIRTLAETLSDTDRSEFPTLAQKNSIIDDEARKLFAEMVNNNLPVARTSVTVNANGSASYALATPRILKIAAVRDARFSVGGNRSMVRRANNLDRNISVFYGSFPAPVSEITCDFEVDPSVGWVVKFFPPSVTGPFEIEVVQGFAGFSSDSSEWFGPDPSPSLIAVSAALRFKRKEDERLGVSLERDRQDLRSELWQNVAALAPPAYMEDHVSLMEGLSQQDIYRTY